MQQILPAKLLQLAKKSSFPMYVVGGAVRDFFAGLQPAVRDWDICAPAQTSGVWEVAKGLGFGLVASFAATGSLKLCCDGINYEFTSFRTDSYSGGGHAPRSVEFTSDISLDARRRDFTCNAVYYDICAGQYVDPLGGMDAINKKTLVPCKPPHRLFCEDALRILRMCRFCGELGFVPAEGCVDAAAKCADGLADISPAMCWREFEGILRADKKYGNAGGAFTALGYMNATGALAVLFPELVESGCEAVDRAICAVQSAPANLRAEAFLCALGGDGAAGVLKRYGFSKTRCLRSSRLISAVSADDGDIRRFVFVNHLFFADLCALRGAVYGDGRERMWLAAEKEMKGEGVPFSAAGLAVRGDELKALGVAPGKVGKTLSYLLERCLYDGSLNRREALVDLAEEYNSGN